MRRKQRFGDRTLGMPDRRASHRFPLKLAVRYRSIGSATPSEWTTSESVNISSNGLFFRTPEAVMPGQSLEAMVSWPVLLDKHIPLRLVTKGSVVRNATEGTAMRFETYEFRTSHIASEKQSLLTVAHGLATNLNSAAQIKIAG
jgi:hypothetical protein